MMDFTQIPLTSGFCQNMVVVYISRGHNTPDGIEQKYEHIISQSSNNSEFVKNAWDQIFSKLIDNCKEKGITEVEIFSDGGPKHYKCAETVLYFHEASEFPHKEGIQLTYHYFPSYHGHHIYDGVGNQLKRKLLEIECHTQVNTVQAVAATGNKLKNHLVTPLIFRQQEQTGIKFPSIRKAHKISFNKNIIQFYRHSTDTKPYVEFEIMEE